MWIGERIEFMRHTYHPLLTGFAFLIQTIDLINYFVAFGDLIMPDPASLYALYYEIVRSGIEPFSDLARQCK
jgi:hypothetical protein